MEQPDKTTAETNTWRVFGGMTALITLIVIAWGYIAHRWFGDLEKAGTFGDTFGVVNALFSGLAFAGVIHAILLQRRELELQRRELEMTRIELRRTAEAQEKSEQALRAETESHTRAYLKIELIDPNFGPALLTITNEGKTPAENVRLRIEPEVYSGTIRDERGEHTPIALSRLPLFERGGFTIAPACKLQYRLLGANAYPKFRDGTLTQPTAFDVIAEYTTRSGTRLVERTALNIDLMKGTWSASERDQFGEINRNLEKLGSEINKLGSVIKSDIVHAIRDAARHR